MGYNSKCPSCGASTNKNTCEYCGTHLNVTVSKIPENKYFNVNGYNNPYSPIVTGAMLGAAIGLMPMLMFKKR